MLPLDDIHFLINRDRYGFLLHFGFDLLGQRQHVRQAVPEGITEERFEQVLAFYLNYYPEHCAEQTVVFPGIRELIAKGIYKDELFS